MRIPIAKIPEGDRFAVAAFSDRPTKAAPLPH
jgi:hypothetical protein